MKKERGPRTGTSLVVMMPMCRTATSSAVSFQENCISKSSRCMRIGRSDKAD